jgi:Flp pilus assembly protein TadG
MQSNQSTVSQGGVSALEFTIIAPLLFVLIFGLVEFGIIFYDKAMITNASREGARAGIVYVPNQCASDMEATAVAAATAYLQSGSTLKLIYLKSQDATLTPPQATMIPGTGGSNEQLQVTVTWTYHFLVLPNFRWGNLPSGISLNAVSVMVVEQNPAC